MLSHVFSDYDGSNVHSIYYEDGGKDVEYWAGHFGARFSCASVIVHAQDTPQCVKKHIKEREIPSELPFSTFFNTGIGEAHFINGKKVKDQPWNDLRHQEILPTFRHMILQGERSLNMSWNYNQSFNGGSCLSLIGPMIGKSHSVFALFATSFLVEQEDLLFVEVNQTKNVIMFYQLQLQDGTVVDLCSTNGINEQWIAPQCSSVIQDLWQRNEFSLKSLVGKEIVQIQVCCMNPQADKAQASILLGAVQLYHSTSNIANNMPSVISNVQCNCSWNPQSVVLGEGIVNVNLEWTYEADSLLVDYCNIYQQKEDKKVFIGRAKQACYRVDECLLEQARFVIEPVTVLGQCLSVAEVELTTRVCVRNST